MSNQLPLPVYVRQVEDLLKRPATEAEMAEARAMWSEKLSPKRAAAYLVAAAASPTGEPPISPWAQRILNLLKDKPEAQQRAALAAIGGLLDFLEPKEK
jgi:hypothetical protein